MKISDIGEDGFIERIKTLFPSLPPQIGIGDDCAVIPIQNSDDAYLITTDALIEGVHFLSSTMTFESLGFKSAIVNLSDIAAKGGEPLYAFLSLGVPSSTDVKDLDAFLKGMKNAFDEMQVELLGGDTVLSPHIYINLTLMGKAPLKNIKLRKDASFHDLVCVDGFLGDSQAGLELLLKRKDLAPRFESLMLAHQRPRAHSKQGIWLSKTPFVHAMMDLSDGLLTDLPRLAKASQCGVRIDIEKLPLSEPCKAFAKIQNQDPIEWAIGGGEDYCLLFTLAKEHFDEINAQFEKEFGYAISCIGEITDKNNIEYVSSNGPLNVNFSPFQHFPKSK